MVNQFILILTNLEIMKNTYEEKTNMLLKISDLIDGNLPLWVI
jgi:hypothetical protein